MRLAILDDVNGFMDIYYGDMEGGILSASNLETGTAFPDGNGGFVFGKLEIEQTSGGFQIRGFISSGKDQPFEPYMSLDFSPVP